MVQATPPADTPTIAAVAPLVATVAPVASATFAPAETPTLQVASLEPTAAATAIPTVLLATPSSDAEAMGFGGVIWVDARPAAGEIVAYINGQVCGRGRTFSERSPHPDPFPFFTVEIASDALQSGCGTPGSPVMITINGRALNDNVVWEPGIQYPVRLVVGPAFGEYRGSIAHDPGPFAPREVVPYIDGQVCGMQLKTFFDESTWSYVVVVDPDTITPGCGRDGSEVDFRLAVSGQPDIDLGAEPWKTDRPIEHPTANLAGQIVAAPAATAVAQ